MSDAPTSAARDTGPGETLQAARRRVGVVLLALAIGLSACAAPLGPADLERARPESVGLSSDGLARLDRVLDAYVEDGRLPGYQLLVARRGRIVHERVRGSMDREEGRPLRPDTIYRIYSMSKVVTGVATMVAWERGAFLLGEPVSKYLPELADLEVMLWDEDGGTTRVPARREMTILDLLRHTSGLTYHFIAPPPLGRLYVERSITPGLRPLPSDTALGNAGADQSLTLGDLVARLGELPLIDHPGGGWHYGIGMDVLGRLIEVTTGQTFPDFLAEHVFAPAGMTDTAFHVPDEKIERFAALYSRTAADGLALADPPRTSSYRTPPAMPGGGGGLVGTAHDYMRFAQMLLDGGRGANGRVLGPRTVELMTANHLPEDEFGPRPLARLSSPVYANEGLGVGFGLTGSVVTEPAWTGLPVSAGTFGWGGAASTFFWIDPEEQIAVVFMTQLLPSSSYPLRGQLMKGVHAAILD